MDFFDKYIIQYKEHQKGIQFHYTWSIQKARTITTVQTGSLPRQLKKLSQATKLNSAKIPTELCHKISKRLLNPGRMNYAKNTGDSNKYLIRTMRCHSPMLLLLGTLAPLHTSIKAWTDLGITQTRPESIEQTSSNQAM